MAMTADNLYEFVRTQIEMLLNMGRLRPVDAASALARLGQDLGSASACRQAMWDYQTARDLAASVMHRHRRRPTVGSRIPNRKERR